MLLLPSTLAFCCLFACFVLGFCFPHYRAGGKPALGLGHRVLEETRKGVFASNVPFQQAYAAQDSYIYKDITGSKVCL